MSLPARHAIEALVRRTLEEDVGSGDLTAVLIPSDATASATVIAREEAVIAGRAWFDETFRQLGGGVVIDWHVADGDRVNANQRLCQLHGPARALLTGERSALNLLQTLSGTATVTRRHVEAVAGTGVTLLDTRKTLPGLRLAQKYAVRQGGGQNHRIGLFDAVLIKENHIAAAGSIAAALERARATAPAGTKIEVEVEDFRQLEQALAGGATFVLLDNFSLEEMRQAVALTAGRAKLEASGDITLESIRSVAETGIDFISIGALTKHVRAVDLSMRFAAS